MGEHAGRERPLERLTVAIELPEAAIARLRDALPEVALDLVGADPPAAALAETAALLTWNLTPERLRAAPHLRWVQTGGAGVDGFPLKALAERGIVLTNLSGVHAPNIAEHTFAMMLAFARRIPALVRAQEEHRWRDTATHGEVFELGGQTILLVGLGDIGQAVATRATAFGMRVLGARRSPDRSPPAGVEAVFGLDRLDEALGEADQVVVSLPLTTETRGLFNARRFAAMRPGAFLHNVGRGAVVETAALTAALASGHLAGAGLDVVDPEPLPPESPLWTMENVLITSHTSGATPRYWERGTEIVVDNVRRYRAGEPLRNLVDLAAGY